MGNIYYYPDDIPAPVLASSFAQTGLLAGSRSHKFDNLGCEGRLMGWATRVSSGRIYGPARAGKSTVLPKWFSRAFSRTVITIMPTTELARAAQRAHEAQPNLYSQSPFVEAYCIERDDTPLVKGAMVWVSSYRFISWLQSRRGRDDFFDVLTDAVVLVDQLQDQSYYIDTLDCMVSALGPYKFFSVINAPVPPRSQRRSLHRFGTFDSGKGPENWKVGEGQHPWSFRYLERSTLIYLQNPIETHRLYSAYFSLGVETYVLDADSPVDYVINAVRSLSDAGEDPVVILADDSFRNGFLPDVVTVIDAASYVDEKQISDFGIDAAVEDPQVFIQDWMAPLMVEESHFASDDTTEYPMTESGKHFLEDLYSSFEPGMGAQRLWENLSRYDLMNDADIMARVDAFKYPSPDQIEKPPENLDLIDLDGDNIGEFGSNISDGLVSGHTNEQVYLDYLVKCYDRLGIEIMAARRAYVKILCAAQIGLDKPPELYRARGFIKFLDMCAHSREVLRIAIFSLRSDSYRLPVRRNASIVDVRVRFYSLLLQGRYDRRVNNSYKLAVVRALRRVSRDNEGYNREYTRYNYNVGATEARVGASEDAPMALEGLEKG